MSADDDLTRKQRREHAREERREAERRAAAASTRRRRLWLLAGALSVAIVAVGAAVAISSVGGTANKSAPKLSADVNGSKVPYAKYVSNELAGIPQQGITLGNPNAPVTLVWFGDLQCPICREFHANVFSTLINDYVRPGKVKLVWRNLAFIGPDSTTAASMAAAAGQQNKEWNFLSLFYYNQQEENSGYVTPAFLKQIAGGAGLDVPKAVAAAAQPAAGVPLTAANQLANNTLPQIATPSFLLGKTGTTPQYLNYSSLTPPAFTGPIDSLLKSK